MDSFDHIWLLLNPQGEYKRRREACRRLWQDIGEKLGEDMQRDIWRTINQKKKQGFFVHPNPYFAINDCVPLPTNWNGRPGINDMMKSGEKMVSARFKPTAKYGIYTLFEAQLFEMEDITPLNYHLPNGR